MSLSLRQVFLFVTVVAIAWVQTAGIHRGYLCECGDRPQLTVADHCHGPHSEACHDQEVCGEDHGVVPHQHGPSEEKQDHPAVKESLIARHDQVAKVAVKLPSAKLVDFAWTRCETLFVQAGVFQKATDPWHRPDRLNVDCWPQRLAHSIALRI